MLCIWHSILPFITKLAAGQDSLQSTVSTLGKVLEDELAGINSSVSWQVQHKLEETGHEDAISKVRESLDAVHLNLSELHGLCENLGSQFGSWVRVEAESRRHVSASREAELTWQLEQRQDTLADRETELRGLMDDLIARVDKVREDIARNQEGTKESLQQAMHQIKERFDTTLCREREWSTQKLEQTEAIIVALQNHTKNTIEAFEDGNEASGLKDTKDMGYMLQEAKRKVSGMTERIRILEEEASHTRELRERWNRDIHLIDSLRGQLSAIHQRMPRVESIAAKLEGIGRLNGLIHSTACYLQNEKRWIGEELLTSSGSGGVGNDTSANDATVISQDSNPEAEPEGALEANNDADRARPTLDNLDSGVSANTSSTDFASRKVMVYSPVLEFNSPSPPPSIEQEQVRRREGVRPRSILRFETKLAKQPEAPQGDLPLSQNLYNRPVTSESSTQGKGIGSIVDRIRSAFVPENSGTKTWKFPTLAEFGRSGQSEGTDCPGAGHKRTAPVSVDNIHKIGKRFKADTQDAHLGDLRGSRGGGIGMEKSQNQRKDKTLEPRRVKHTYSRKSQN